MNSGKLLLAIAFGLIVGLIIYWINFPALQGSTGEPEIWWVLLIALVVVIIVYLFLSSLRLDYESF